MKKQNQNRKKFADKLYQEFVKPLETKDSGKYIAVSISGKTILGPTVLDVLTRATSNFGPGNSYVFQVGRKIVGKWR